jgi:hypothetical protein
MVGHCCSANSPHCITSIVDKSLLITKNIVNQVHILLIVDHQNCADSNPVVIWFLALNSLGNARGSPMASKETWESNNPPGETRSHFCLTLAREGLGFQNARAKGIAN